MQDIPHSAIRNPQSGERQLALDWTLDPLEARVLALLRVRRGRAQAITVPDLAALVADHFARGAKAKSRERIVQHVIRRLVVEHGEPILSGGVGVWYAATAEELLASYREQRRKGITNLIRQRAVYRRHLARLRGQAELPTPPRYAARSGDRRTVEPPNAFEVAP